MQRSLLLNALVSMVALAVAYPMPGVITGSSVAKRKNEAASGVYFPISYDDDKKRSEDEALGVYFPISYDDDKKRSEDEALGVYFPISYDDDK
ncbi:uncharacterized protein BJ212DRAFT_39829 [Suillus subaureus]|uniref:Uncharacterized protein n=1 Tax=Suillus subaureus TaxID=48587 RepID=A0A9P7EQC1_9AGAM|nr:uncharacterized protein BJ212DRAFT_39829 [Suillus subaureus]KAG1827228.1 hypothetical protein BJ212DRAFT_39829 [Suillus subaureus]